MTSVPPPAGLVPPVTFSQPWQLRTFAVARALVAGDVVDAAAFDDSGGEEALRSWLSTIERALLDEGLVSTDELEAEMARQAAVAAARTVH